MANAGDKVFVPKTKITSKHKVHRFGKLHHSESEEYKYLHQRMDLKVSRGDIPIAFLSSINLVEGQPVFLETREHKGFDEPGPFYQVTWKAAKEREPIGVGKSSANVTPDGWCQSLDDLWVEVLAHFERKNLLSEETLEYLDADPYVLFGIDDAITQQALQKLKVTPALMCDGTVPVFEEWSEYMRIKATDQSLKWLVQAFAETELPRPWTCYKGVGSVVCYIRSDTGQVTWKHPFYDYFRQLRDFCQQASREEVMQVRVNRLLWSYEATRIETEHDQDPLVCPEYVSRLADIFGYRIKEQGYLVRNLKAQLKVFSRSYRKDQSINMSDIITCAEILNRDVDKFKEMKDHWGNNMNADVDFELTELANGMVNCVNCGTTALCFCLECKDYLCLNCYDLLHAKGARLEHAPFRLVPCSICVKEPAKLHCTFTDKSLCHQCYAMDHIKMLPPDGKENQPRRIDYLQQYSRYATFAHDRQLQALPGVPTGGDDEDPDNYDAVLSTDWHPFYDVRGVKYYHNFMTGERMRQSPRRVPNELDPGAELVTDEMVLGAQAKSTVKGRTDSGLALPGTAPLELTGFDSLKSFPPAVTAAACKVDTYTGWNTAKLPLTEQEDKMRFTHPQLKDPTGVNPEAVQIRELRPPHRVHKPSEVNPG